jgi:hypothetical protein
MPFPLRKGSSLRKGERRSASRAPSSHAHPAAVVGSRAHRGRGRRRPKGGRARSPDPAGKEEVAGLLRLRAAVPISSCLVGGSASPSPPLGPPRELVRESRPPRARRPRSFSPRRRRRSKGTPAATFCILRPPLHSLFLLGRRRGRCGMPAWPHLASAARRHRQGPRPLLLLWSRRRRRCLRGEGAGERRAEEGEVAEEARWGWETVGPLGGWDGEDPASPRECAREVVCCKMQQPLALLLEPLQCAPVPHFEDWGRYKETAGDGLTGFYR